MSATPSGPSQPGPRGYQQQSAGQPQSGYQYPSSQPSAPNYGQTGYGQPGYGQQVYAPYAVAGSAAGDRRPGSATAAAVLGFIFGTFGFFGSSWTLIALTGAAEGGLFGFDTSRSTATTILMFAAAICVLIASILVFVGAVQLLSGKTNRWIVVAAGIFILSQVLTLINFFVAGGREGAATIIVGLLISSLLAGLLIFLAVSSDVRAWLARRSQTRSTGYGY